MKHQMRYTLLVLFGLCLSAGQADAVAETIVLWPGGAPGAKGNGAKGNGAKGNTDNDKPAISVSLPVADKATGAAVVVCPGGGYGGLAMDHEGRQIAEWLNSHGIAAAVLTYRHRGTGYGHPAPILDAQRAIRTVRSRAAAWKIDPKRIGIIGFSAGGHLASTAATHFDDGKKESKDLIDRAGCRPDFAILCYPVISLTADFTHQGSKRNLLGNHPDAKLALSLSNEKQVTSETPPTFLFHTGDDGSVPVQNSVAFYLALRKHNVPAEMHLYETGRHGLGLARGVPGVSSWPDRCVDWMRGRGLLKKNGNK